MEDGVVVIRTRLSDRRPEMFEVYAPIISEGP